jgi:NADH-quinone oxidoreductase subunit G
MVAAGRTEAQAWQTLDDITAALAATVAGLAAIRDAAPAASLRIAGLKIAREPHRYSGRTAMHADATVHEPKPPDDPDSPLTFTMEGYQGQPPSSLIPRFWAPGWNSVQSVNYYQTRVGGPLRGGDPGRRLIEPSEGSRPPYFDRVPSPFVPEANAWLAVPLHHIFGSEELSALAPGIAGRMPRPYVALNTEDHASAGVREGDEVIVGTDDESHRLVVHAVPTLPAGLAGLPSGLPSLQWLPFGLRVRIRKPEAR